MRWNFLLFTALYKTRDGVAAASAFKAAAESRSNRTPTPLWRRCSTFRAIGQTQ
jgi:hypothetical protein